MANLYDALLLSGDFLLALQASELLYSSLLINPQDFPHKNACSYYLHRKNLQFINDLENIYYINLATRLVPITNCRMVADSLAYQILMFSPVISTGPPSDFFAKKLKNMESCEKFAENDFVLIFLSENPEISFIAKIVEIDEKYFIKCEALLSSELLQALNNEKKVWFLRKLHNFQQSERNSSNLLKFCTSDALSSNLAENLISAESSSFPSQLPEKLAENMKNLNFCQNLALNSALSNSLTLIDAPRSSGKKTVIVEIITEWLKVSEDPLLLVTNNANSLSSLYRKLANSGINPLRLDVLHENCQHFLNNPMNFAVNKHKYMKKVLKNCRILLCTCLEASSEQLKGLVFTRVIVENADKVAENTIISAFLKKCKKLVLCGDSRESAVFTDKIVSISKGFNISLFKRLINQGQEAVKFNVVYNKDPSIVKTISLLFKENFASFQQENSVDLWLFGLKWPNFAEKVLFVNVKGEEKISNASLENFAFF